MNACCNVIVKMDADEACTAMAASFQQSAERSMLQTKRQAHKPCFSEVRVRARASRNPHLGKILHGQGKQSVKMDRLQWLDDLFDNGRLE